MNRFWWQLPGPSQFVTRIGQELREGKNLILSLPQHSPSDISRAIRLDVEVSGNKEWRSFSVSEQAHLEPAHQLLSRFDSNISPRAIQNVNTLAANEKIWGKVIWLTGVTPTVSEVWKDFVVEYAKACGNIPLWNRAIFCLPIVGRGASRTPVDEVFLSHFYWRGVVSSLDMLFYTFSLMSDKPLTEMQKRVAISIISKISLWDPHVCERLASEKIGDILQPTPVLQNMAKERDWLRVNSEHQDEWEEGVINFIDGQQKIHFAALASRNESKEIERQIWGAEVEAVFPFIEILRQKILQQLTSILRVPYRTRFGVIEDLYDLEVNHIHSQIKNNPTVDGDTRMLLEELTRIRNRLAHLKNLDSEMLTSEIINKFIETQRWAELRTYIKTSNSGLFN